MKYNLNINPSIGKDGLNSGIYPVLIYQLIRQYSNADHPIRIADIEDTLHDYWKGDTTKESNRTNLKKTIKRNLTSLLYFDSNIQAAYKNGEPFMIDSGDSVGKIDSLWYEQELTQTDLQLLSDSIVYSKHLNKETKKDILKKLMAVSGHPVTSNNSWYFNVIQDSDDLAITVPIDLYNKLGYIEDAITNHKCIAFDYCYNGPNYTKLFVRSYFKVSPYKIIHDNGIYYLIAAINSDKPHAIDPYEKANKIIYLEIHKLDKLRFDDKSEYLGIENTVAKDKNLQDILSAGYRPDTHEVIPFRFKVDVHLRASSRGLDVLIDHFGQRIAVIKLKEKNKRYGGPNPELANMYDVVIKDVARNDWYDLITLWLRYPADDITVMEDSKNMLVVVQYQIENRIRAIK